MAFRKEAPPNSRLFILCQRGIAEREFRENFGEFGQIEDVWIVKDKRTNEDRGIVYISFKKTSEAMLAMESMNGRCMVGQHKPLKVVVANSKREGSTRDPREDEKLVRLFVMCPKTYTEKDLQEHFEPFGDLQYVSVMRDKSSGECKGFGYVKYHRPYHAALAYEQCDRDVFKPRFAEPQRSRDERENKVDSFYSFNPDNPTGGLAGGSNGVDDSYAGYFEHFVTQMPVCAPSRGGGESSCAVREASCPPALGGYCQLQVVTPVGMTPHYLTRLMHLVPGLEYCDLNQHTGLAYAKYATPQCAIYARDKLHGFEYPLGSPLTVRLIDEHTLSPIDSSSDTTGYPQAGSMDDLWAVRQKAASVLEKAGISPSAVLSADWDSGMSAATAAAALAGGPGGNGYFGNSGNTGGGGSCGVVGGGSVGAGGVVVERVSYCNTLLPLPQPLAPDRSPVAQRLFIVCQPSAIPEHVLRDAFSRFANLIDVFLLAGRNYGYAKYMSKESAMKAIQTLHGQILAGQRIKVLEAEPPKGMEDRGEDSSAHKQL